MRKSRHTLFRGRHFDDEIMNWVRDALTASHRDERREHDAAIRRLQTEYDRLNDRVHAGYTDKLDGRIDVEFLESKLLVIHHPLFGRESVESERANTVW